MAQKISSPSDSSEGEPQTGDVRMEAEVEKVLKKQSQSSTTEGAESSAAVSDYEVKVQDHNMNVVKEDVVMHLEAANREGGKGPLQKAEDRPLVPQRVTDALKMAESFSDFKRNRTFRFLHLFSGKNDVLGDAIRRAAGAEGIQIEIVSFDSLIDKGLNLAKDYPYLDVLEDARNGGFDGGHAGPPCGSFSRARWNPGHGPVPVRSLEFIYGLPSNSVAMQAEADAGTTLFVRSLLAIGELIQSQRLRKVPEVGTIESPPGSESQMEGPAWQLPETKIWVSKYRAEIAWFNTCAYQKKESRRWWKAGQFAGCLDGIAKLKRKCSCTAGFRHEQLVGKSRTAEAAQCPKELVEEYAKLVIQAFKTTLNLEWWRAQEVLKQKALNDAQRNWIKSKEQKAVKRALSEDTMRNMRMNRRAYDLGFDDRDMLPQSKQPSKKARKEEENAFFVGGMRNPAVAVRRMHVLAEAGREVAKLWRDFEKRRPEVLETARTYGTERCEIKEELAKEWRELLRKLLKAKSPEEKVKKDKLDFISPLKGELWRAWQQYAKDPDLHVPEWIETGAPLGMGARIPPSGGVFPPVEHDAAQGEGAPELEAQLQQKNYKSVYEDSEASAQEMQRLIDKGFVVKLSQQEIKARFSEGTVSKLALISKVKESGTIKHRFIIDLLRSGGNDKSQVPERIVLPRAVDVIHGIQDLWRMRPKGDEVPADWAMELVGADLQDAYMHFGVHPAEHPHCITPSLDEDMLLFIAMLFGFRGAPLIMGRMTAMLMRMWQSMLGADRGVLQCYMDDPLLAVQGSKAERNGAVAMLLYTAWALGVNMSYAKGERGSRLVWIGITIEVDIQNKMILLNVPQKMIDDLVARLSTWQGVVSLKTLRATTGKLSWLAGVLPRCRWAVAIMYAVVASCERDQKLGLESERAKLREKDKRDKSGLVPLKRIELPRQWFLQLFKLEEQWRSRKIPLEPVKPKFAIVTDASPLGVGMLLAAVDQELQEIKPLVALKGQVTKKVADWIGVAHGESSSQSTLEAWTILLALRYWASSIRGQPVLIRADSTVALCLARKLRSSSAPLNWVGAEMAAVMETYQLQEFILHHLAGKLNEETDYLSRPDKLEKDPLPSALKDLQVRVLQEDWMMQSALPPPGVDLKLWGKNPQSLLAFDCM